MFKYQPHFPYKIIRPAQSSAIEFALETFLNSDKKYAILEAGTGVGKSAIGFTIASYLQAQQENSNGTYYITTQKVLQEQYVNDFKTRGMKSIKSASNFRCSYHKTKTCSESLKELKISQDSKFKKSCSGLGCNYRGAKADFLAAKHGVTNFPYFLMETNLSGQLQKRDLMVIDECHNTELELSKFVEVVVTQFFAERLLKLKVPDLKTQFQVVNWIKSDYMPKLKAAHKKMESTLEQHGLKGRMTDFISLSKKWDMLDGHLSKLTRFLEIYDKDNWIMNIVEGYGRKGKKFEFKPIDIAQYTNDYLFNKADKVLLMSATIMQPAAFCKLLGISKDECSFISIPSPFPVENRPIFTHSIGSMSRKYIEESLPVLATAVSEILKQHANEKGIIHCHNYKIAEYLKQNIRSDRLITHENASERDKALWRHINEKEPTVLLSPSMSEGVDLKDDASRFQILCKVPYPYLGDKLVKKRMHRWKWWYPLQTAKTIVQSVGRSIRNSEDYAVTYILDSDFERFWRKNSKVFPADFRACIVESK